jgi:hypothetical protein
MLDSAQNTMQNIGATSQIWNISNTERMNLSSTGLAVTGAITVNGFDGPTTNYFSLRPGFAPTAVGGSGIAALDHVSSNADGIGVYGHDGLTLFTGQTARLSIAASGLTTINNGLAVTGTLSATYSGSGTTATFSNSQAATYGVVDIKGTDRGGEVRFFNGATALGSIYVDTANTLNFTAGSSFTSVGSWNSTGLAVTGAITPTTGVYLGGTAAANLLDDYEEGTWTPSLSGFTTSGVVTATGQYRKIGSLAYIRAQITVSGGTTAAVAGTSYLSTIPFTAANVHGCVTQDASTGVGLGTGSIQGTVMYPASYVATANTITVDGTYFV